MNERTIFLEALEKDNPEQRSAFLDEVCGEDAELRQRVDKLLSAHNDAGSFLEKTPQEIDADSVFGQTEDRIDGPDGEAATDASTPDDAWLNLLTPSDDSGRLGNLGPYEVCELVGRGGMGVVLRAHEPKLSRTVAVKLLAPELALNPVAVQRFLREARAAAAVSHDHVVAIHSIDDESHPPVIVMEFIQGQSLQQKIDKVGALDVKSILRIGMQTAAGLSAAHRQGLVHRDIKPANILLENGIERVKLTDFGLARAVDDISMTRTGQITGTPQYMSPEQAQGQRVDHRTDLFSLGCVFYAMCTGRAAFRADSAVAVMHRVVHDVPRPIAEVNEDIPNWLCEIVDKLLAKEANDRFSSAEEVEDLLSRHLAHLQQPANIPQASRFEGGPISPEAGTHHAELGSRELAEKPPENVPSWLFWKIPNWAPLLLVVAIFVVTMLSKYGPEAYSNDIEMANIIVIMVSAPLVLILVVRKLFGARVRGQARGDGQSYHTGFWMVLFALVPMVAGVFAKSAFGNSGPAGVIVAVLIAFFGAVFLHKKRTAMGHVSEAPEPVAEPAVDQPREDRQSRFVDISEDFEKDLQGVGSTLMFVGLAAMLAPLGTYLISDQVDIPFVEIILGFFLLTSLLIFPITMRASLDLNWLPITRRRPGAAMLVATSLAIVPWNPLLLIMLPWTLRAMRRVRQPDVLQLIGVSEDDPRVRSVWGTGLGLLGKPAFVIVALAFVVFAFCEVSGSTHIGIRVKGIVQGTGTISFEGLRPGGSVLGPGNAATTADDSHGHYEAALPAGQYEIVSVTDRSFVKREPLTVHAGDCGSVIVEKDADGLIIREANRTRRSDGVISISTRGEVTCKDGDVYLPVTGRWGVFVPPGQYRVTTILKDGSFSKTTNDVTPMSNWELFRVANNVAEVRIARMQQQSSGITSDGEPRSQFFQAFTEFVMAPEKRSDVFELMIPYHAGKPVTKRVTDDSGRTYLEWEVKSTIEGTSNSLRNNLPAFRDYVSEVAKENGARITKTTPTDGEHRAVAMMVVEFETATSRGTIQMQMTGFEDKDLHGHQMLTCGLRFEIQEQQF